jgi:hypothetical protein
LSVGFGLLIKSQSSFRVGNVLIRNIQKFKWISTWLFHWFLTLI